MKSANIPLYIPNARPECYPEKEFGYVDISSIDNKAFRITESKRLRGKDAPSRAKRPIKPNDTLFSNVRTYLRNIALVDDGSGAEICSTGFTVLRPTAKVHPKYLFRYVLTDDFIDRVTPQQTGTHYPATSDRVVRDEVVPLPPLDEQNRVVAKLEVLLSKVDGSRKRLEKIPVLLKRFRQSVLAAACSGRLTEDWRESRSQSSLADLIPITKVDTLFGELPETWDYRAFSDVIVSSFYGPRFGSESYSKDGVPTIRTTDMAFDGSITLRDTPRVTLSDKDVEKYRLHDGDMVVTRTGATIGKCAIYTADIGPALPGAYLIRFRLKTEFVAPRFVLTVFMSPVGQSLLIGGTTAVAQPNVNATTISQFEVPVPPLLEQIEIVKRVETLFKLADQIQTRYEKGKQFVDKLTQSILAKAFRGELVPQDPDEAPVEEMLMRNVSAVGSKPASNGRFKTSHCFVGLNG